MINKIFKCALFMVLSLTVLFLTAPLFMLISRGISYIGDCMASEEIIFSIRLSMITSVVSTVICLILAVISSYAIYRARNPLKGIVENLIYTPMSLPHLVSGIALLLLFGKNGLGDPIDSVLNLDFIFTVQGIVLAQVFINLPFTINMIHSSMEEVDDKKIFISRNLGCNEVQSFAHILLPSIRRGLASSVIMTWSRALGEFGAVMMVAGTTRMKTEVIPTAIYLNMATGEMNLAIGTATLLILISLASTLVFKLMTSRRERGQC